MDASKAAQLEEQIKKEQRCAAQLLPPLTCLILSLLDTQACLCLCSQDPAACHTMAEKSRSAAA